MRVIILDDYDQISRWTANYVAEKINNKMASSAEPFVLGCPTGSSPLGMYRELIRLNKDGKVSFKNVFKHGNCINIGSVYHSSIYLCCFHITMSA